MDVEAGASGRRRTEGLCGVSGRMRREDGINWRKLDLHSLVRVMIPSALIDVLLAHKAAWPRTLVAHMGSKRATQPANGHSGKRRT